MSTEEYRTVRNQAQRLSTDEQFRLLEDLVAMLKKKSKPQHSILELEGLGKEVWEGIDVDEYIRESRGSWEPKNDDPKTQSSSQDLSQQGSDDLQEDKNVDPPISTIAKEIAQKTNSATATQIMKILREYERQKQTSLPSIVEKIKQERDAWGG